MAQNQTRRLAPATLSDDEAAFNALQKIPDYAPANPNYTVGALTAAFEQMRALQAAEDQAAAALSTARDAASTQEWAVHNLMLGVKDSIRAQYGKDSSQVQEVGLKRPSEYKRRRPKTRTASS